MTSKKTRTAISTQVSNPSETTSTAGLPVDNKQIAEQLLATCVAEIKQGRQARKKVLQADGSLLAHAKALVDELKLERAFKITLKDYESGAAILQAAPEVQKEIFLLAMDLTVKDRHGCWVTDRVCYELLKSMPKRKLPYDDSEIVQILTLVMVLPHFMSGLPVPSIISIVERHVEQHGMSKSVLKSVKKLTKEYSHDAYSAPERKIGIRIKELLDKANPQLTTDSPTDQAFLSQAGEDAESNSRPFDINTGEAWTNALLVALGNLPDKSRNNWHQLLAHCGTVKSAKPTKKFLKHSRELLEKISHKEFVDVLCPTLASIGQDGECEKVNYGGRSHYGHPSKIHDAHVEMLRGLVWSSSLVDDQTLIGAIGDAAEKCFQKIRDIGPRSPKIGNACLIALSSLASDSAVAQLGRLKSRAKHVSTRKQIAKALAQAAGNAGISTADLVELGVPDFGLTEPESCSQTFGDFTAEATIHPNQSATLVWKNANGKSQKSVPARVKSDHASELKALKKRLKEIDKLMPSVRHRIEQSFLTDRNWSMKDFRKRFLDHPIVGIVARRLIWNVDFNGTPTAVIWHKNSFVDLNNQAIDKLDDQTRVTPWHPLQCSADEVLQWRQWLDTNQVSQPFKQAHREIYILTDAERDTATYSNRFANHIVRQHQLTTLLQQRGWRYNLQGEWDSWNIPFIDLPQYNLRAEFFVEPQAGLREITDAFVFTHLATDQVRFLPIGDGDRVNLNHPLLLAEIPALVFSEIMRDVDLFVATTSVGNDPEGRLQLAENGLSDYWERFAFGDLSETSVTRKQTLGKIIPRLEIAKQCRFDGKFLIVEGRIRTYKIHLGSGNILMSPNDQYLCIVQKRGSGTKRTDNIFLPFKGDNTLSLILSKAFLLADDDKIKDQTIVNQIRLD